MKKTTLLAWILTVLLFGAATASTASAENEAIFDDHTGDITIPAAVLKNQAYEITLNYSKSGGLTVVDVTPAGQEPAHSELARAWGSIYSHWMYQAEWDLLWDNAADPYKQRIGDKSVFSLTLQELVTLFGKETQKFQDKVWSMDQGASHLFTRVAMYENIPIPMAVEIQLDAGFKIMDFGIRDMADPADNPYLDYQTQTQLMLPFEGEWATIWGGRTKLDNYHVNAPDQRFAYDFLIIENGLPYTGDGSQNEDHFAFGKPLLAPGDGVIVASVNTIHDNAPMVETNEDEAAGNYVVIDHGNGEYSLMAHFKQGSLTVGTGDTVKAGQVLGLCGNSGNSDMPHLHYHLMDGPDTWSALGMPAWFHNYEADGVAVSLGEPLRGQKVQNILK